MIQGILTDDIGRSGPALHQVRVAISRAKDGRYALLISDASTDTVLGRVYRPADFGGNAPRFEIGDVLAQIGGAYRTGSVEIDLSCLDLRRRSASVTRALKQCDALTSSLAGAPQAISAATSQPAGGACHV